MQAILSIVKEALMITAFVAVMMLLIEYLNVITEGRWQERLSRHRAGQYLLAAFLGALPGCLGAFAVVAMYAHRRLSLGAVVAAMIATAGDESFVMFAMVPGPALALHGLLFGIGVLAGALADLLLGRHLTAALSCEADFQLHAGERFRVVSWPRIAAQWKPCSAARGTLAVAIGLFLAALVAGQIGPESWDWIRGSMVAVSAAALFIVATVPDHFLEEHLWGHVVRGHVPRVFLWTAGAMLVLYLALTHWADPESIRASRWTLLGLAGLVGLIPESGPHLVFVTLYAQGLAPFAVLLASSIVQDGHGMLPLLAHSRRAFVVIKLINLLVGWAVGALWLLLGQ